MMQACCRLGTCAAAETGDPRAPLLAVLAPLFRGQGIDPESIPKGADPDTCASAIASAGQVRDRFSPDGWSALADLDKTMRRMAERVEAGDDAARALSALLRKITGAFRPRARKHVSRHRLALLELCAMSSTRRPAWRPRWRRWPIRWRRTAALDLAVEVGDSVMTHRRRFAVTTSRETVVDLLALDAMNPRSILFQLDGIHRQVGFLPGANASPMPDLLRLSARPAPIWPPNGPSFSTPTRSGVCAALSGRFPTDHRNLPALMQYRVRLSVTYHYARPASGGVTLLRPAAASARRAGGVANRPDRDQPPPGRAGRVHRFLRQPHRRGRAGLRPFRRSSSPRPARWTACSTGPGEDRSVPLAALPDEIAGCLDLGPAAPHHFLGRSPRIRPVAVITDHARGDGRRPHASAPPSKRWVLRCTATCASTAARRRWTRRPKRPSPTATASARTLPRS
ncbi:MAG: alpha-E domain-containing protein [Rhodopseudomonas palustris]|nr:alpha-E domain-containing protein [Rhodopseudomonas palustris]